MTELLKTVKLSNGVTLVFRDRSNRYFGDFHRVYIEVKGEIPLDQSPPSEDLMPSVEKLSGPLCYEKTLERMGVPTVELSRVKTALIADFLTSSRSYLEKPTFPCRFLQKKLAEKPQPASLLRRSSC